MSIWCGKLVGQTKKIIRRVTFSEKFFLQAALGVVEEVVLDDAVQAFFDSPEIGLIRAKEVLWDFFLSQSNMWKSRPPGPKKVGGCVNEKI